MTNFQKILFSLYIAFLLYIFTSTLLKKEVQIENTIHVSGKLLSIRKYHPEGKLSISYLLNIEGDNKTYKIIPEFTDCFNYNFFVKRVKNKQLINMKIDSDKGLKSKSLLSIVSIKCNDKEFLNLRCINSKIRYDKAVLAPIILLMITILIIFYKKRKNRINKSRY